MKQILAKTIKDTDNMMNLKVPAAKSSQKRLDAAKKIKDLKNENVILETEDLGEVSPGHKIKIVRYSNFTKAEHDRECQLCGEKFPINYMVLDEIWIEAGFDDGVTCLKCLGERLNRKLERADFQEIPFNRKLFAGMDIAQGKL